LVVGKPFFFLPSDFRTFGLNEREYVLKAVDSLSLPAISFSTYTTRLFIKMAATVSDFSPSSETASEEEEAISPSTTSTLIGDSSFS
jgi:hypothetical protein